MSHAYEILISTTTPSHFIVIVGCDKAKTAEEAIDVARTMFPGWSEGSGTYFSLFAEWVPTSAGGNVRVSR